MSGKNANNGTPKVKKRDATENLCMFVFRDARYIEASVCYIDQGQAITVLGILEQQPEERKAVCRKLREVLNDMRLNGQWGPHDSINVRIRDPKTKIVQRVERPLYWRVALTTCLYGLREDETALQSAVRLLQNYIAGTPVKSIDVCVNSIANFFNRTSIVG